MLAKLSDWFDHRTGFRKIVAAMLIEEIPGGAKWRYVWGSALAFVFAVQLITGVLLMTAYSAGDSTAWSSVYFIQYEMDFGWLIRGLHHFGSATMVVLIGLHMLQVVIAGAHLPPREVNWWLGLLLMGLVLAMSLTGYLLPWDQKGYWATQVATNIAGNLPGLGRFVQKIAVGGPEYGHHTLTRFYALHVGILPPLIIVLIIAHLVVFRRHGVTHSKNPYGEGWFWPDQAFRDMLVSMVIFAVLLSLVLFGHGHKVETPAPEGGSAAERTLWDKVAHAGQDGRGANLDAPADPSRPYPARPEWYFLFLFQLLKYFEGDKEIIGTVVIPNGVLVLLALLPLFAFGQKRGEGKMYAFAHGLGVLVVVVILGGAAVLTGLAIAEDRGTSEKAELFQKEQKNAEVLGKRAVQLAGEGIPAEGAVNLLRRDPLTRGQELFKGHCATCHNYGDVFKDTDTRKATASDLAGWGTKDWIRDLLREPDNPRFFGRTKLKQMTNWAQSEKAKAKKQKHEGELEKDFDQIAEWLAEHPRKPVPKEGDQSPFAQGYRRFEDRCLRCHPYQGTGGDSTRGPDFTGYGDAQWLRLMVMAPESPQRYGAKNAMPAFMDLEGVNAFVMIHDRARIKEKLLEEAGDDEKKKKEVEEAMRMVHLSDVDRELIIRWVTKDYRVVFGGEPIAAPPPK